MRLASLGERLKEMRRSPAVSAWPFVVVIFAQMAIGGISVYTLSAIRAYVTNESLWTKGEQEAIYFLSRYLETKDPRQLEKFDRAIETPIEYRAARNRLEAPHPDLAAVRQDLLEAGASPDEVPSLIWMFRNFRGFYYLEESIARWKESDPFILELQSLGESIRDTRSPLDVRALTDRLEKIQTEITPRAIAFSAALDEGARVVERLLTAANLVFASLLAALTMWRVGKVIRQRRQVENALVWQAAHDELTGLLNRRAFEENLVRALEPVKGTPLRGCTLMFIDLDQFKIVNDTCGHAAGDALLRRICPALQQLLSGPDDLLARFGGDEFGILLPGADMDHSLWIAESVRSAIEEIDFLFAGRSFGVTASIGLIHDETGTCSPEDMMSKADMACFMAKEKGRNRVHAHRDEDKELLGRVREMNWVQRIQHAISEDRFCLYAQEIVALGGTQTDGVHLEVLVRMRDEAGDIVPPSSFLPAAERFSLIKLIDYWVVRRAFLTLAERRKLAGATPIGCCSINLSGATIGDDAFLDFLKDAFAEFGIAPDMICFEITETTAVVNLDAAREFVRDLSELGCTFALDDFGAGMSSFNYLKELPVDYLKIDGSFVRNLLTNRFDRAMVEMICRLGHIMGKRIVAEFVETEALAIVLRDIGIDFGQGFGLAPPKPFDAHFEPVATPLPRTLRPYARLTA